MPDGSAVHRAIHWALRVQHATEIAEGDIILEDTPVRLSRQEVVNLLLNELRAIGWDKTEAVDQERRNCMDTEERALFEVTRSVIDEMILYNEQYPSGVSAAICKEEMAILIAYDRHGLLPKYVVEALAEYGTLLTKKYEQDDDFVLTKAELETVLKPGNIRGRQHAIKMLNDWHSNIVVELTMECTNEWIAELVTFEAVLSRIIEVAIGEMLRERVERQGDGDSND
jgi:hypothetical protein